ncbi:MAG: hypothetical protein O3B65_02245 [Chloroflexi bacterium]|nr:hypothetical protein [Chloroflexota bacterium]
MAEGTGTGVGVDVGAGGVTADAATKASTVAWRSTDSCGSTACPQAVRRAMVATDARTQAKLRTVIRAPTRTLVQSVVGINAVATKSAFGGDGRTRTAE